MDSKILGSSVEGGSFVVYQRETGKVYLDQTIENAPRFVLGDEKGGRILSWEASLNEQDAGTKVREFVGRPISAVGDFGNGYFAWVILG